MRMLDNKRMNSECAILRVLIFYANFAPGYPRRYPATHNRFSDLLMTQIDNPFESPKRYDEKIRDGGTKWRSVALFNTWVLGTLFLLAAVSSAWSWIQSTRMEQALGRRYISYDHEYTIHVNWIACAAIIGGIFAIANIGFFTLGPWFRTKMSGDLPQNE